ncbi:ribosomal protein S3 [Tanacetum coccineum]|uniref:Ribosomal protein S3 n=1 Tax=Tanacetum coccineum TaxID=301880 RepID=A0ABQ5HXI6_9ASTR
MTTASSCCEGLARNQTPAARLSTSCFAGRSAGALFSNQNNSELYQDVNLRSYFGSIRPPTRLTFGFRLGRCIILHFPKRTFIHFFLPRRPRRQKRREKSRPGKGKGQWWAFGKVGPIGCLHSSDGTEEERNEVRARGAAKRVESIRLDDREKQNEIRIWPKKKQRYGYHDRSPSIKKNLSKSLRVSGAFKHPKYAGLVNEIALLNDDSFRKTKLFKFFFSKKSKKSPSDSPTSHPLKRTLPAVRPSLNYSVMQYLLKTKNQMHFDPVVVLNHFVEPGVLEPSTMGGANAQGRSLDKRIRFAFFVESSTSEKKFLAEDKKLTHFIRWSNHPRFAGTTKTTISLFPFFGATFFFPRDGVGVYNNLFFEYARPPRPLKYQLLRRCIILHFPKRTFIHFFLPRRPRRQKRREKSRPGKGKGQWWAFGKVGPIGCLHSSDGTEEERNEVRARGAAKRVESIRLDDREKQNEIRIWPKKKQRYGYHDRSPSIKKNLSKSLRVSGAFKHPKYAGLVNEIALLNDDSFRKTKLFKFFFSKKSKKSPSDSPTSHPLKRTLPAVRPSLNYSVMQYLLKTKNQMHFDPVVVLNHFVEPGVLEPSTMGGANAQGRSLDKRIRFAFFVESSTSEKKFLAEDKKLTHFIRWSNHPRFAGTTKTTISLFPFFGATFFFPRDGVGVYNNLFFEYAREQLLRKFRKKCWNLMAKDKVMELIEKFIDLGGIGELIKGIEMMIEIILRNRRIPYGYNFYLNEVKKMRSLLSNRTKTNTLIESVKIKSVYQSASPIAQDISFQPRNKTRSFRSIFSQIVKDIQLVMKKGVEGIRICCSGRSEGAEIARTECKKYGKTSSNVFNQKIDYAPTEVSTRYGISDLPITGKPTEVRMGRGKGNPAGWIARVSTGQIPFEMDGVSLSNARQAATLAAHKLFQEVVFYHFIATRSSDSPSFNSSSLSPSSDPISWLAWSGSFLNVEFRSYPSERLSQVDAKIASL